MRENKCAELETRLEQRIYKLETRVDSLEDQDIYIGNCPVCKHRSIIQKQLILKPPHRFYDFILNGTRIVPFALKEHFYLDDIEDTNLSQCLVCGTHFKMDKVVINILDV